MAVGRVGDRTVDDPLDAEFREAGEALEAFLQPGGDPVVVGVEQLVLAVPGTAAPPLGDGVVGVVEPDQRPALLASEVACEIVVLLVVICSTNSVNLRLLVPEHPFLEEVGHFEYLASGAQDTEYWRTYDQGFEILGVEQ